METEKPSALNQRLQAAKERREKQQKEREAQRTGSAYHSFYYLYSKKMF